MALDPSFYQLLRQGGDTSLAAMPATEEEKGGAFRKYVVDPAMAGTDFAVGVGESLVGAVDIPLGGRLGNALSRIGYDPEVTRAVTRGQTSPEMQRSMQAVEQAGNTGEFLPDVGEKISALAQNPRAALYKGTTTVGPMLAGGAVGRSLSALGGSALVRGAASEGIVGAGMARESLRQQNPDGGYEDSGAALLSGAGTALLGYGGARLGQRYGVGDIESTLAGRAAGEVAPRVGVLKGTLGGGASELVQEVPQSAWETGVENVALGRPIDQGMGAAVGEGAFFGFGFGAGHGTLFRGGPVKAPAPPAINQNDQVDLLALPAPRTGLESPDEFRVAQMQQTVEQANAVAAAEQANETLWAERNALAQASAAPRTTPAMDRTAQVADAWNAAYSEPVGQVGDRVITAGELNAQALRDAAGARKTQKQKKGSPAAPVQEIAPDENALKLQEAKKQFLASKGSKGMWTQVVNKSDDPTSPESVAEYVAKNRSGAKMTPAWDAVHTALTGKSLREVEMEPPAVEERKVPPMEKKILELAYPSDGSNPMSIRDIAKTTKMGKTTVEKVLNRPENAAKKQQVAPAEWTAHQTQETGLTERNLGADAAAYEETREGDMGGVGVISTPGGSQVNLASGASWKGKREKGYRFDARGMYSSDELGAATADLLEERSTATDKKRLKQIDTDLAELVKESERRETSSVAKAAQESNPAKALWEEKQPDIAWEDPGEGDFKFLTERQQKHVKRAVKRFEEGDITEDELNTKFEEVIAEGPLFSKLTAEEKVSRIEAKDDAYLDDVEIEADVVEDGVWKKSREKFRDVVKSLKEDIESLKALRACIAG